MKIRPYLFFNGNCRDAIAFYENVFGSKAYVMFNDENPNLVDHAQFNVGEDIIMLCDWDEAHEYGQRNMMITINFDENDKSSVEDIFKLLAEGGKIVHELEEVSWSKCFGLVVDKFGFRWNMCQL
ncbi:MAG: VOC family protein [Defluviitaleaceae bacterium]|nr:VOC family protein [Defluviitaleaceae bacterium]